jgi:hypothetical protein
VDLANLEAACRDLAYQEEENGKLDLRADAQDKLRQELEHRIVELDTQEELHCMEATIPKITLEKRELRCEKEQLEDELRETEKTPASARDAVHEWEGELLEGRAWFSWSVDMNVVADTDVSRFFLSQSSSRQIKVWKISLRSNLAMLTTQFHSGKRAKLY